eukprot:TRINITY_DN2443_c0_g1_i9.p6 TRINITY_DN2443_c0_g1~~TRINITY_DN2443_c0_g1_i9.p6  ORF type:complete len:109 (-),score=1.79 TRINITY_DN2443_c0_g1_i9:1176-1502(-)
MSIILNGYFPLQQQKKVFWLVIFMFLFIYLLGVFVQQQLCALQLFDFSDKYDFKNYFFVQNRQVCQKMIIIFLFQICYNLQKIGFCIGMWGFLFLFIVREKSDQNSQV